MLLHAYRLKSGIMKYIVIGLLVIGYSTVLAQDISKINLAHLYDPGAEVGITSKVISTQKEYIVYLQLQYVVKNKVFSDYNLAYSIHSGYNNNITQNSLEIDQTHLISAGNEIIFKIAVPKSTSKEQVMVLRITNIALVRDYYFDIPLSIEQRFGHPSFSIEPSDDKYLSSNSYFHASSPLKFQTDEGKVLTIYGFRYQQKFNAALPPMIINGSSSGKSMEIDSTFQLQSDQPFSLNKDGLYFFQSDTTQLAGVSIIVKNQYYPKLAFADDLIDPIVYISTRLEYRNLTESINKKQSMDQFWMKVTGEAQRASRTIRYYYRNVERANLLFTNYKEGWKTDKGIIYITFGPPNEVYRNGKEEIWIYNKNESQSKVRFNFIRYKNIFSGSHDVLKRERSYEKFWYRTIDLWRKGRKGI